MSANPYAPPSAHVADIESAQNFAAKPIQVKVAVVIVWLTWGVGLIRAAISLQPLHVQGYALLVAALVLVSLSALLALWTYRISRGGRWARLTYGLMVTAGVLIYLVGFVKSSLTMQLDFLLLASQTVLQMIAVVLLFTPPANRWFRQIRSPLTPAASSTVVD